MIKIGSVRKKLFSIKLRMLIGGSQKKNIGIAPTLSQYGLNLREFTMYFDSVSFFVNNHFEVGCTFNVVNGKIVDFVLFEPSSSFFINNFFLYKKGVELSSKELLKLVYEISHLKSNRVNSRHISLRSLCKIHISILKSYSSGVNNNLRSLLYV